VGRILGTLLLALSLALMSAPAQAQYPGGYVPPGGYQNSCRNMYMQGPTLFSQCTAPNGQWINSSLNVSRCAQGTIANTNGQLTCQHYGGGGGGGGGHYGIPSGGYQNSCRNAYMRGSVLTAQCTAPNGAWVTSSLDTSRCAPGAIANSNGQLTCSGGGGGGGGGYNGRVPAGGYQNSCRNISMNGPTLYAQCTAPNGAWINSQLNVSRCVHGTISNNNGRLGCQYY
jgi:hypothetical protein